METALKNLSKGDLLKVIFSREQALSIRDEKIDSLTIANVDLTSTNIDLISTNVDLTQQLDYLKSQVEMYKRMQFGQDTVLKKCVK